MNDGNQLFKVLTTVLTTDVLAQMNALKLHEHLGIVLLKLVDYIRWIVTLTFA